MLVRLSDVLEISRVSAATRSSKIVLKKDAPENAVVHGMPGAAIKLDAATLVLAPEKIAAVLTSLANNKK